MGNRFDAKQLALVAAPVPVEQFATEVSVVDFVEVVLSRSGAFAIVPNSGEPEGTLVWARPNRQDHRRTR